jgi:hypothetical protein
VSTHSPDPLVEADGFTIDPVEEEAQQIFSAFETASPEAQARVLARLVSSLAGKINGTLSTKVLEVAKQSPVQQPQKISKIRKREPEELPPLGPQLYQLRDNFDPIEAWEHFGGAEQLKRILPYEPLGVLEAMLRHPRMPAGTMPRANASRETVAKTIISRLEKYFNTSRH